MKTGQMNFKSVNFLNRSERVRREKPDYYDALKFGGGPSPRPKRCLSEKIPYRSAKFKEEYGEAVTRGRPRKHGKTSIINWKKGRHNDDDDDEYREKKKKKKHHRENKHCSNIKEGSRDSMNEEDEMTTMEELPSEKILQCQVSLAEINRKLGVVMFQPQPV